MIYTKPMVKQRLVELPPVFLIESQIIAVVKRRHVVRQIYSLVYWSMLVVTNALISKLTVKTKTMFFTRFRLYFKVMVSSFSKFD